MKWLYRTVIAWIPLGVTIIGLSGLIYVAMQQNYRQSLNDPQIQMAEDSAFKIDNGSATWQTIVPQNSQVSITTSLAPWIAITDAQGHALKQMRLGSTGTVDDIVAAASDAVNEDFIDTFQIPVGVFQYARSHGEDRITWQSDQAGRQAIVVVPLKDGNYVITGRNMREVEKREAMLEEILGVGMLILLIVSFIAVSFANSILTKKLAA
jgi:hypothetical protein